MKRFLKEISIVLALSIFLTGCTAYESVVAGKKPETYSYKVLHSAVYDAIERKSDSFLLSVEKLSDTEISQLSKDVEMLWNEFLPAMMIEKMEWSKEFEIFGTTFCFNIIYSEDAEQYLNLYKEKRVSLKTESVMNKLQQAVLQGKDSVMFLTEAADTTEEAKKLLVNAYYQEPYSTYFADSFSYSVLNFDDACLLNIQLKPGDEWQFIDSVFQVNNGEEAIEILKKQWNETPLAPVYINFDYYVSSEEITRLMNVAFSSCESVFLPEATEMLSGNSEDKGGGIVRFLLSVDGIADADIKKYQTELEIALTQAAESIYGSGGKSSKQLIEDTCLYLCDNIEYDMELYNFGMDLTTDMWVRKSAYGALVLGNTVCTGYARAFKLIMDKFGIDALVLGGYYEDEGHEWNAVVLDQNVYYVDVTFADTSGDMRYSWMDREDYSFEPYIENPAYYTKEFEAVAVS